MIMRHACANPHCTTGGFIPLKHLACRACWAALPETLRDEITKTWRVPTLRHEYAASVRLARDVWAIAAGQAPQGGIKL